MAVGRVVDLKNNVRAGFDELGLARAKNFGRLTRRVADEEIAGKSAGIRLLFRFDLRRGEKDTRLLLAKPMGAWFANVGNDVMNDRASCGANFGGLDPSVFGESSGDDHVLVVDHAGSRNVERYRQFVDAIGFPDAPALHPFDWRRHVLGIALRRAGVGPRCKRLDFGRAETHSVGEFAVASISKPRRHLSRLHVQFHRHGPRPGLFIGQHRKWSSFALPMANLAIPLKNRGYVPGKRRSCGRRRRTCRLAKRQCRRQEKHQGEQKAAIHLQTPPVKTWADEKYISENRRFGELLDSGLIDAQSYWGRVGGSRGASAAPLGFAIVERVSTLNFL